MVTLQQDVADVTAINCRQDHGQSFITAPDLRRRGRIALPRKPVLSPYSTSASHPLATPVG